LSAAAGSSGEIAIPDQAKNDGPEFHQTTLEAPPACQPSKTIHDYPRDWCGQLSDGCTRSITKTCEYGGCLASKAGLDWGACRCTWRAEFDAEVCGNGTSANPTSRLFLCVGDEPGSACKPAPGVAGGWCCP
jgi:hypothetical protein